MGALERDYATPHQNRKTQPLKNQATMAERPTTHSVAVCTLIALHSDPSSLIHNSKDSESADGIEVHLSKVIKHIVLHDGSLNANASALTYGVSNDIETLSLPNLLRLIAGPSLKYRHAAQFLLQDLNQSCSSIDSLIDLFAAFRATVAQGVVDGDSAHGVYVRKRCLGFDQLGFDSVGRFWEACCDYVEVGVFWDQKEGGHSIYSSPSDELAEGKAPTLDKGGDAHAAKDSGEMHISASHSWPLAPRQISRTLFQKCHDLDQQMDNGNFDEMESQLQDILRENPELTLAHYLRFLNCLNHGERVGALEHFHRYFDYAMIQERKDRLSMPNLPEDNNNNAGNNNGNGHGANNNANDAAAQSNKQKANVIQYVTIVLASLFHKFGNDEMAHMATQEAIKVAQQSGDGACLAYALGWLHATTGDDAEGSSGSDRNQLLERASARGGKYNLRSLIAGASLQRAAHHVMEGSERNGSQTNTSGTRRSNGFDPSQAWESIAGASASSTQAMNAIGNTIYLNDIATNMTDSNVGRETFEVFAQQHLVGAGLWQAVGRHNLSLATNRLSIHCYDDQMSNDRLDHIANEIAFSVLYGTGSDKSYFAKETPEVGQPLCGALDRLRTNGKKRSRKNQCPNLYVTALDKMRGMKTQNPNATSATWYHNAAQIIHEASTRKCDFHAAESYELLLRSYAPATTQDGVKTIVQTWGHSCLLLCQKGKWDDAKYLISKDVVPYCQKHGLHYFHCYFLLQLVMIYLDSSPDDPTCALPSLLECLALSEKQSIDPIHAAALSLLSRMHFEMDNLERAKATMKAAMPVILQHGHVFFQGEAWLTLAKCTLSEVKDCNIEIDGPKHMCLLKRALVELKHAAGAFEKIQDVVRLREVYYLKAHVCSSLPGHLKKRDVAAKRFQELNKVVVSSVLPVWHDALVEIMPR